MKKLFPLIILALISIPQTTHAATAGKIYLQVEAHGEAWYINPADGFRYFLGRPHDAFELMRRFGLGISDENLRKIPLGFLPPAEGADADWDGLSDYLESVIGTDPLNPDSDNDDYSDADELKNGFDPRGQGKITPDAKLINRLRGQILLQTEKKGEAWYLNPDDGRRYFLGRPADAFAVMRELGAGITNIALAGIPAGYVKQNLDLPYFSLKYPNDWTYETGTSKLTAINGAPIAHDLLIKPPDSAVTLRFYALTPTRDMTLGSFEVKTLTNADLIKKESSTLGVKPTRQSIFTYNKKFTDSNKQTIDFGERIFFTVMDNTRDFVRAEMFIPEKKDIPFYEAYFKQIIKDLKLK